MNNLFKRTLIAFGVGLVLSVAFVSPCVTQQPSVPTTAPVPQEHAGCNDASCPLPAGLAVPAIKVISQENWQFTLPGIEWIEREPPAPDIKVAIMGSVPEHAVLVLFIKENVNGTFADYVIGTVHAFAEMEFRDQCNQASYH